MSRLIAILSPAKLLDDKTHYPELPCSVPEFLQEAGQLVEKLKKLSGSKLASLMDTSRKIGEENAVRYASWSVPFTHQNAFPAILMFRGEVYRGMNAAAFDPKQLLFAEKHLRIISGLYGLLHPLDLVMPYRLMMGTPFSYNSRNKNLYAFWGNKITDTLTREIDKKGVLVNLASAEYFKAINPERLDRRIIHCEFREEKNGKLVNVMTYSKLARGSMARFLVENEITNAEDLKAFDKDRYTFRRQNSNAEQWVFAR